MRKPFVALVSAAFLAVAGPSLASAQTAAEVNSALDTLFGDHAPYEAFLAKLKKAVAADDRPTVASMIDYPVKARIGKKAVSIKGADRFLADYDKVFTAKVKEAVARQTYATLFANAEGVMIGDGELWFSGTCEDAACTIADIKVTAINN